LLGPETCPRALDNGCKLAYASTKEALAMSTSELKLRFDAVYYHVRDIEKSVAFYRDILGFHLTSRDYVARFDLGGVLFELVPNPPDNVLPGTGNARVERSGSGNNSNKGKARRTAVVFQRSG
jgi:hypothetical protein